MSDELVPHSCRVEGEMEIERGKPCNWCGTVEPGFNIPLSLLKPEPIITDAERLLGRPIYHETRRRDEQEMRNIYNRRGRK